MKNYGGQSMVLPLRRVVVRRPTATFATAEPERWNYTAQPDLAEAQREHDALVETLSEAGAEVSYHDEELPEHADSIYVFDPVLVCDHGAVVLSMGKDLRRGEEDALARRLQALGVPRFFALEGDARAECGDMCWLDEKTLLVGHGFRTNGPGIERLRRGFAPVGVDVVPFDLPYFTGPLACLHLLSFMSLVDHDLVVVYPPLMPVALWQLLAERGLRTVEVPEDEFPSMGPNVLALAPGRCLMLEGNPVTQRRLERAGCDVTTYRGREISWKAEGGPTCLTRPVLRG